MKKFILGAAVAATTALMSSTGFAGSLFWTGTVRDFKSTHPDFEKVITGVQTGAVQSTLSVDGKPQFNAAGAGSSYSNAANFNQWYRDVAGVNMRTSTVIELADNGAGGHKFDSYSFLPINNQLFGNSVTTDPITGNPVNWNHNYHFTFELSSTFDYKAGDFFELAGDDDVYLFIDGQLVADVGGVHGRTGTTVDLDTLGLVDGQEYELKLFFAERHTTQSALLINTNIDLKNVPEPAALGVLGLGLVGIGFAARRRRKAA